MAARIATGGDRARAREIGLCSLAIILALVGGVGLATGLVIRHVVQTAPLWIGVGLSVRGSRAAGWFTVSLFVFWLVLMTLIWLYLTGLSTLISGHFSPFETLMTIVVGMSCVTGIWSDVRYRAGLPATSAAGLFVGAAAAQVLCFRLSLLPGIAHR